MMGHEEIPLPSESGTNSIDERENDTPVPVVSQNPIAETEASAKIANPETGWEESDSPPESRSDKETGADASELAANATESVSPPESRSEEETSVEEANSVLDPGGSPSIEKTPIDSEEISRNYEAIERERDELLQKSREQELEIITLRERVQALENQQKSQFDRLIQQKLKQDSESWEEDESDCQKYQEIVNHWIDVNVALNSEFSAAIQQCEERFSQCSELTRELEKIPLLYNNISSRHEGIKLIQRMLERLREPLASLKTDHSLSPELTRIQERDLFEIVQTVSDERQANLALDKKVREVANHRYQLVREWRDLAESLQKEWLHFVEKKILPVLDGIDEGKKHSESLVEDWKLSFPNQSENLSAWLQTYPDLKQILVKALENLKVTRMDVSIGQPVDYLRHEPIATEPDSTLNHESVKEIARDGYEYQLFEKVLTLRGAQIIVVKNR